MDFLEYDKKHPLTRFSYMKNEVQEERRKAFIAGKGKKKLTRSQKQNKYYFKVVCYILGQHLGYSKNEMHQEFGRKFLSYEHKGKTFIKSTTELNTSEFEEYLSQCRQFASEEFNCFIPKPNETELFYKPYPKTKPLTVRRK